MPQRWKLLNERNLRNGLAALEREVHHVQARLLKIFSLMAAHQKASEDTVMESDESMESDENSLLYD